MRAVFNFIKSSVLEYFEYSAKNTMWVWYPTGMIPRSYISTEELNQGPECK